MNDGCKGCKYEDTPCIIRICGNAPGATAEDIKTLEKCTMLNKIERESEDKAVEKMTAEEYRALIDENRNADGEQVLRNKKSSARGRALKVC